MRPLAMFAMLAALGGAVGRGATPTLDALTGEAAKLKAACPDRWAEFERGVDRAVDDHDRRVAGWRKRSAPPGLDLRPLGLPLAFLAAQARHLGEEPEALFPGGRRPAAGRAAAKYDPARALRHAAYLEAIAGNPDERRIEALREYRDDLGRRHPASERSIPWPAVLAGAATRGWAVDRIRDLAREAPPLDPNAPGDSLPFRLIGRFAGELPPDAAKVAYDYLVMQSPHGPTNGDRIWDVLFRLDPPRARREVLAHFDGPTGPKADFNIYVVMLLEKHAGPSPEVARAARTWLEKESLAPYFRRAVREILLRADPDREVKPAVEHVDRLLAEHARKGEVVPAQGDVHRLVLALGEVDSREADDALARYAFDRTIPESIRALALASLVKHDRPGTPALAARWLAEASPPMREYVRKQARDSWGEPGRRLLEELGRGR
ncbi:hypothetical protein OJF2_44860 [Aquisphaera giovannonii]|uniref:Uncharacterized protein n=1 Tax=Aquisphaera giovannonii TaxID=406548 RepID=A0A5B9W720_9BACT|nr:hypothetical protein [Aquisphaera giovannonii]QEH35929.1 hypothetical protein OJF2_44860 [Aquisphaera giovannonii]